MCFHKIKNWYEGEGKFQTFENDPDSNIFIAPIIYTDFHWTAKIARILVKFYLRNWQWLWGTVIAIVALYVAIKGLKIST